jgi:hypothetical protein
MPGYNYQGMGIITVRDLSWDARTELFKFLMTLTDYYNVHWRDEMTTAVIMAGDCTLKQVMNWLEEKGISTSE